MAWWTGIFCGTELTQITNLKTEIQNLETNIAVEKDENEKLTTALYQEKMNVLYEKGNTQKVQAELDKWKEDYHPVNPPLNFHEINVDKIKNDYKYPCRGFWQKDDKWHAYYVDLRIFCTPKEKTIQEQATLFKQKNITNDERMKNIRNWVIKNIDKSATQDKDVFGVDEYYQFSWETLDLRESDCDDSGILIRDLAEASGVPSERLLVLACDSLSSGHMLCIYCRELDNEWVAIDAVYFPTTGSTDKLPLLKTDNRYVKYQTAFNGENIYRKPILDVL